MEAKGVMITGKFTEGDWADLCAVLRMIEQRHPEEKYQVVAADPNLSMQQITEIMERTFPRIPGQEPEIKHVPLKHPIDESKVI